MHPHAVEFKPEAPSRLRHGVRIFFLVEGGQVCDLLAKEVDVFDISLVESDMHLDLLVRNARKFRDVKFLSGVLHTVSIALWILSYCAHRGAL